jgi:hypothetical protein
MGCSPRSSHRQPPTLLPKKTGASILPVRRLALEEILSWRKYADLVGMTDEEVVDNLGEPQGSRTVARWGKPHVRTFKDR